jgi:hypothetical protein
LPPTVAHRTPTTVRKPSAALPAKPAALPAKPPAPPTKPAAIAARRAIAGALPIPRAEAESTDAANALMLRGEYWDVRYEGRSAMVEDCRGLRYIAVLVRDTPSGKGPIHAKELVALATGQEPAAIEIEKRQDVLDNVARKQLLERLEEIASDRDAACAADDLDRAAALDEEYERIAEELSRAAAPGRSHRATFGDAGEKARKAVGKAVSEAIARIASCPGMAPLAEHLTSAIRKGQWLSYSGHAGWHIDFRAPLPRK